MEMEMQKAMDFVPEKGFYQPSTDETWESYQALYSVVEQQLGGIPRLVICGVADEILGILRNRFATQLQKRFEIECLIGKISIDVFNQLVLSTNEIKDYNRVMGSSSSNSYFSKENQEEEEEEEEEEEDEGYFYQPRSSDTWTAYNMLVDVVVQKYGVQPELVLFFVANEILAALKDEKMEKEIKMVVIGNILNVGPISEDDFDNFVNIEGLITDYNPNEVVGPTDVIREEEAEKTEDVMEVDMKNVLVKEISSYWELEEEEEEDLMVENENHNVGPIDEEDLIVRNEKVGPTKIDLMVVVGDGNVGSKDDEYLLVKEVNQKLVLSDETDDEKAKKKEDEEEEEEEWVLL